METRFNDMNLKTKRIIMTGGKGFLDNYLIQETSQSEAHHDFPCP